MLLTVRVVAQKGAVELMGGDNYIHYQHSLAQSFKAGSKLGWQHIATLIKRYHTSLDKTQPADELMNQAYVTAAINSFFSVKSGLFYTNAGGFTPSVALQFMVRKKQWALVVSPRTDIKKNASYELFAVTEYMPALSENAKLYFRLQAMSSVNKQHHNRSYQLLGIGLAIKELQFGTGLTLDEYGTKDRVHNNMGIFIRKAW